MVEENGATGVSPVRRGSAGSIVAGRGRPALSTGYLVS